MMKQLYLVLHPGETGIEKGLQKHQMEVVQGLHSLSPAHKMQWDLAELMSQHTGMYWLWKRKRSHHPHTLAPRRR